MRLIARKERKVPRGLDVSYNIEPDSNVFVASVPISGEHSFETEKSALAWIKEVALEHGIIKENVWVEESDS